jgi:hypothetical protein
LDLDMTQRSRQRSAGGLSTGGELLAALIRAESVTNQLDPDQHGDLTHARAELWRQAGQEHHGVAADRRARVLAHPDLSRRLCLLLSLSDPRHWNGFVPPSRDGYGQINTSPIRAALVTICREAYQRAQQDGAASA